jgi:hypothetical protein
VQTAADCAVEIPACKAGVSAAEIEAPCERYKCCDKSCDAVTAATDALAAATQESASVAAAFLLAAAAFA